MKPAASEAAGSSTRGSAWAPGRPASPPEEAPAPSWGSAKGGTLTLSLMTMLGYRSVSMYSKMR